MNAMVMATAPFGDRRVSWSLAVDATDIAAQFTRDIGFTPTRFRVTCPPGTMPVVDGWQALRDSAGDGYEVWECRRVE